MHSSLFATAVNFNESSLHLPIGACQAIIFFMQDAHVKMPLCVFNTFTVDNNRAALSRKVEMYLLQTQSTVRTQSLELLYSIAASSSTEDQCTGKKSNILSSGFGLLTIVEVNVTATNIFVQIHFSCVRGE